GPAPSGVSQVDPLPGTAPVQVAVGSGAPPGAASGDATSGGAEPGGVGSEGAGSGGAEPAGAEPEGVEPGGAESEGAESRGVEPRGAASSGGPAGVSPRLSSQQVREWLVQCAHRRSGAPGARGAGDPGAGGAAVPAGAGGTGGAAATGPKGARTSDAGATGNGGVGCTGAAGAGVGGPGAGGAGAAGAGVGGTGAGGAGGAAGPLRPRPYFLPLLQQSGGLIERREPATRPVSLVRTARLAPRLRPPPVPGTNAMALRPSSVPLLVPLPAPPESSLPDVHDPESDCTRAATPTVSRLLAAAVTDPSFEAFAESAPASPPSVGSECALGTDVLEDRQEDFECLAATVPRFASMLLAPEGARMLQTSRPRALTQRRLRARYVARGFSQQQGVDYFHTFSPTPKMTTLRVLLHVAAQRDCELHSLEFSTAFLQGSLDEEIWLRRPPGFTGTFPAGTQSSLRRPVFGLRHAPRKWHDTLRTALAALGFAPSTADPSLFLRTDMLLPLFYVLVYVDDLVFATTDTKALTLVKSEL
ncbi:unnamed protein product, partial [Closterium sp. NIES-54]